MLDIALYNPRQHRQFQHPRGPLVLARAATATPLWMPVNQTRASEAEALIEILADDNGIALAMAGCEGECYCGRKCGLTGNCRLEMPARFSIGDTRFEISDTLRAAPRRKLLRLHESSASAANSADSWVVAKPSGAGAGALSAHGGPAPATLSRWFAALGTLNHWATSLQELYVQAARCAVEAIGLDGAIVVRRRDQEWEIAASHLPHPELGIHCDLAVLDELLATPVTMFHGNGESQESRVQSQEPHGFDSGPALDSGLSALDSAPAVVVSPLRNAAGELTGAIYGYRSIRAGNGRRGIRYLEANLIELLARAVCDGAERLSREADVDQRRALAEQALFATLDHDPRRLAGERRNVTLLFADLRGFSQLSAPLSHETVYELLGQVMDCLTAAVMDHDGLVIDYYGDGLAAMWNAPAEQADHAELACRAALRMLESLPEVAADWNDILDSRELRLGIGVHTGVVQAGNAGSRRRMKYGPRGANVHVASRIEAATKKLGLPMIVSGANAARLSNRFKTYRVCRAQLPGIDAPVDLYAVCPPASAADFASAVAIYTEALQLFENGKLIEAAARLATITALTAGPPAQFLADHIECERGRSQRRRSSDALPAKSRGVITINVK